MHVALVNVTTTTQVGGVESFVWELAEQLAAAGDAVTIWGGSGSIRRDLPGVRVVTRPYVSRAALRRLPLLDRQYGLTKLLERLTVGATSLPGLARDRYDIVHIQKPFDLPLGALLHRLTGARLIFGCHGKDFFAGDRAFTRWVDAAVSCSAFNADQVQARYGLRPEVIYNGIDTDRFQPRPADPVLRAAWSPDGAPVLLWAGRMVRWKGAEYAIEALPQLRHTPAPRLALVGDGDYRPALTALAARLGVTDRVIFAGPLPAARMPAVYPTADVVLGTSFVNETFSITSCEAMACGRPVVAADFGGFREVVADGVTGRLVPPQDPAALAAALDDLLDDPTRLTTWGAAGRERVERLFAWPVVAAHVRSVYARALARPPARAGRSASDTR
ncbi:MAG: glycosyltransferase family 4 protein [Chloroflexi bacterium]|nr:glycosyltransferase family 4 protein [Chloroflexota bacterium]